MMRACACLAAWALLLITAPLASGQGLSITNGDSEKPLEVSADSGIEWEQEQKIFTARGNAVAVQGELTVKSDVLRAYYRPKAGRSGGTDIWRLDASGHVNISSPGETATGEAAVYDIDKAVMVLTGKQVRYLTPQDEITANKQLEYWDQQQMAVARGNAYAIRQDRKIRAEVLVARFRPEKTGGSRVYRVEAFDAVHIVTQSEVITADRAVYILDTGIVTLTGNVKITKDKNQLDGCSAEVNLKTGISKLLACKPGEGNARVRGLLVPDAIKKK